MAINWQPKSNMSLSFAIKGNKRGHWKDFATGEGGDILDLVAVYLCGLSKAVDDFPAVLEAAARWAGIAVEEVDRAEIDRRRIQRDRAAAAETAREAARIEQDPDWSGAKSKFFDKGKANGNNPNDAGS